MRHKFIITFFLLCIVNSLFSQQLKGIIVLNQETNKPLSSVRIRTIDNQYQRSTDENGYASFVLPISKSDTIVLSSIGFETTKVTRDQMKSKNGVAYLLLRQKKIAIEEVRISNRLKNNIFEDISKLDIHLRPINNSQEILRSVPGLFIGQHAGGGKAEQLFIRGFDIDHGTDVSISVDGIPVNMPSHAHGQGYADLHFVIPELIEQVAFDKGPYFADKGNFNTAAFVDFKTKDLLANNFVKLEVGQFDTYRGVFGLNLLPKKNNQNLYFASEGHFTNGYFEHPQNFNRFNAVLKYYGNLSPKNILSASITGLHSKWNASGQIPERAVKNGTIGWFGALDPNEGGMTSRYNANIKLATYLNNDAKISTQAFYSKYDFNLYSNFTFFLNDNDKGDQIQQKESRDLYGLNSTYEKITTLGTLTTETKAGIQFRYDYINDLQLNHTENRGTILARLKRGNVYEANLGLFWAQKFILNNKLTITPGLRYDYFNNKYDDLLQAKQFKTNAHIFSPKLNVNYSLSDKIALYAYMGKGFHSNDTRVSVLKNKTKTLPEAWGGDLGGIFKVHKKLLIQGALWYLWLNQEFVYVGDEAIIEESGETQRLGIDLSARYEIVSYLFADFNFSLAKPRALGVSKAESYIPLAPIIVSTGGVTYKKEKGFNGGLRYRWMGNRPANADYSIVAKGYFISDALINYNTSKWEIGASIQNIFNTKWKETQFDTESRLNNEKQSVSEIHFTPGTPFFGKLSFTYFF